jgi:hypothetical protein
MKHLPGVKVSYRQAGPEDGLCDLCERHACLQTIEVTPYYFKEYANDAPSTPETACPFDSVPLKLLAI